MEVAAEQRRRLLDALAAACTAHAALGRHAHSTDEQSDVDVVGTQLRAATETACALDAALAAQGMEARGDALRLLHRLNNQLTGAVSIATLLHQAVVGSPRAIDVAVVLQEGRAAAQAARDIAPELRA